VQVTSDRGLSVRALARDLNIPPQTAKNYLDGRTEPPASFLAKICLRLDVDANWLLLGDATANSGATLSQDLLREARRHSEELARILAGAGACADPSRS
jgi:transcriptional regulator with XRE-family HTH domain